MLADTAIVIDAAGDVYCPLDEQLADALGVVTKAKRASSVEWNDKDCLWELRMPPGGEVVYTDQQRSRCLGVEVGLLTEELMQTPIGVLQKELCGGR